MDSRYLVKIATAICLCLLGGLLTGCGGGGGDGGTVDPANIAPVARPGENRVINQGVEVTLDGSSSTDEDGQIVAYQWEQVPNGATSVSLINADSAAPSFIAPAPATREALVFKLTVTDDGGADDADEVTITVNLPPLVDAGPDQSVSFSAPDPLTITLRGTARDDGTIVAHQWEQVAGAEVDFDPSIATTTFVAPSTTGAYTFRFTVTDDDGAQATDTVSVNVTRILFSDAFTDGSQWTARWTLANGSATTDWVVADGELVQKSDIQTFEEPTSYHQGTFALLSDPSPGDIPLDYRFSVDILPTTNLTSSRHQGNDVGIMFRYQNPDNYYRVSMSARYGFTRLEKCQGGEFTTLAVNAIGYVDNHSMTMAAEVNGGTIVVWIDGDPVFAWVDDDPISSGTIALYCQDRVQFDNVVITDPFLQPMVAISSPLAYSVTPDDSLSVKAVVLNAPTGGTVTVSLDGGEESPASFMGGYYTMTFSALEPIDHDILVSLKNASGDEVSHDINSMVGTGGDYYVSVGDSITNGVGDLVPGNNESNDGRIVAIQGFQAPLADLLTVATGDRPQIVFNEGIGGERASDLLVRIDSILERHPASNGILLMIGTNDAYTLDAASYQSSVAATAAKIDDTYGKPVWLARLMPSYINDGPPITWTIDPTKDPNIRAYNTRLGTIAANDLNDRTFLGPDFYAGPFVDSPADVYVDYLHPSDAGYRYMAEEWLETLNP